MTVDEELLRRFAGMSDTADITALEACAETAEETLTDAGVSRRDGSDARWDMFVIQYAVWLFDNRGAEQGDLPVHLKGMWHALVARRVVDET